MACLSLIGKFKFHAFSLLHWPMFYYIICYSFLLTKEQLVQWQAGKASRRARVGGQGFDPCLLHNIFLHIWLQILCTTPSRHPLYTLISTIGFIINPDPTPKHSGHTMDTRKSITWNLTQGLGWTRIGLANSDIHPLFQQYRPILFFSILIFLILIISLIISFFKK